GFGGANDEVTSLIAIDDPYSPSAVLPSVQFCFVPSAIVKSAQAVGASNFAFRITASDGRFDAVSAEMLSSNPLSAVTESSSDESVKSTELTAPSCWMRS